MTEGRYYRRKGRRSLNEKRDAEGKKNEEPLKEGRKGHERWKGKRWDERTIVTTTRTPNPAMASPAGS